MNRNFRYFFLTVLLIISLVGCATKDNQMMYRYIRGEHYNNIIDFEKNYKEFTSASDAALLAAGKGYLETKNFEKFFSCISEMEEGLTEGRRYKSDGGLNNHLYHSVVSMNIRLFLSQAYMDLGEYDKAVQQAERAEMPKTSYGSAYYPIWFYGTRGLAHALAGNIDKARYNAELLDQKAKHDNVAKEKNTALARIYFALGNYSKALQVIERYDGLGLLDTLSLPLLVPMSKIVDTAYGQKESTSLPMIKGELASQQIPKTYMYAKIHLETGNLKKAKEGLDSILSQYFIRDFGSIYWSALSDRSRIHFIEKQFAEGIEKLEKAIDIIETQRSTINTEANKIGFVGDKQQVYKNLISILFDQGLFAKALEYAERGKARALVDMLASKTNFSSKDIDSKKATVFLNELKKLEMESIALAYQFESNKNTADVRALTVQKKEKISKTSRELASLVSVRTPSVKELRALLLPNETLVEFYYHDDDLFVFIVTLDSVQGIKIAASGLNQMVKDFRKNILNRDTTQFKENAQSLFRMLIQPFEGMITTKNLTIVPHGALHYLPFNALNSGEEYLIERYNMRVLPSASVMKFLKDRREGHAGNLLVFGNPDLGDPNYDLPGAQNETLAITKDRPKSKLLLRKQATETAVKQYGAGFRYLHFATHGTFDAEKPLSSGLLLSGDSENDGKLTVGELYDLYLPADLVTLSACETALGKVANGDDVVGFTRGFLYAGTSSIVSSLWKVDDQATSILMQQFYKSLKESDKRSALRTAQLKVKDTYNSHPYFWAAFQITGSVQ